MILVDSSVWIDYFLGKETRSTDRLHDLVGREEFFVGDIVALEVLQGFRSDTEFAQARYLLDGFPAVDLLRPDAVAVCAQNYRSLRRKGITVRSTIDVIIGTYCIENGLPLLYSDRDFDPFVEHLGLVSALPPG